MRYWILILSSCLIGLSPTIVVAQTSNTVPKVLFAIPPILVKGEATKLTLRGQHLEKTKTLKLIAPEMTLMGKPGKAAVPNGLDAARVGDQQLECELTIANTVTAETVSFAIELESGEKTTFNIPLVDRAVLIDDKEPNKGFSQAQSVKPGQMVRGTIHENRDVDVFRVDVQAWQRLLIELFAERLGTPFDGSLMIHDERGRLVESCDDKHGRDPALEFAPASAGTFFIVVFDANDVGSQLHGYRLNIGVKNSQ